MKLSIAFLIASASSPAAASFNLFPEEDLLRKPAQAVEPTNPDVSNSEVSSDTDECPESFVAGSSYEEGDLVEMNGVVFKCKDWPSAQWCSMDGYEPGSDISANAWDIIGHCEGTIDPAPSVVSEERKLQTACPAPYSDANTYTTGEQVSVTSGGSSIVYECSSDADCNSNSPASGVGWTLIGYCEVTVAPTTSPTPNVEVIEVTSTLETDINCTGLTDQQILELAQTTEVSVYETANLPAGYSLQLVKVTETCNRTVLPHDGYPPARRLQSSSSEIVLYEVVSAVCNDCQEEMFNTTKTSLETSIASGTLTDAMADNSGGVIVVNISPNITSNYTETTSRPTKSPTKAPTKAPFPTPAPFFCNVDNTTACVTDMDCACAGLICRSTGFCGDVETNPDVPSSSPTPKPVTPKPVTPKPVTPRPVASKSSKKGKGTPKPVTPKPTPAPVTPKPVSSKSSKRA